jgi:peptidyl-tRNA hydrolase
MNKIPYPTSHQLAQVKKKIHMKNQSCSTAIYGRKQWQKQGQQKKTLKMYEKKTIITTDERFWVSSSSRPSQPGCEL